MNTRSPKKKINNPVLLLVSAGLVCLLQLIFFYPGVITIDSITILDGAVNQIIDRGDPPLNSLLWRGLIWINGGVVSPVPMLIFQLVLFWAGISMILLPHVGTKPWVTLLPWALLWAPFGVTLGAIWKDVLMVDFLIFGIGLYEFGKWKPGWLSPRALKVTAFFLLLTASLFRHNAAFAIAPFVIFLFRPSIKFVTLVLTTFGILLANYLFSMAVLRSSATSEHLRFIALYELAGLSIYCDKFYFGEAMPGFDEVTPDSLRERYTPYSGDSVTRDWVVNIGKPEDEERILSVWRGAVSECPSGVLKHKSMVWAAGMGLLGKSHVPFRFGIIPNAYGFEWNWNPLKRFYVNINRFLKDTPLHLPWVWLLLATVQLIYQGRSVGSAALWQNAFYISGCLNALSLLPLTVAADFRYYWWSVLAWGLSLSIPKPTQKPGQIDHPDIAKTGGYS